MPVRVGINGFGRIGRNAFRAAYERGADIEWVGVNDLVDPPTIAHLLKYDSNYGPFPGTVEATDAGFRVDGTEIRVLAERDPAALPWSELGADVVIESTGLVIPELNGKLHGFAVRAPVPTGSVVDLTVETKRETSVEEVNAALKAASESGPLQGFLRYTEDSIVSTDIVKNPASSIVDSQLTAVMDGTMVKLV